MPTTRRRLLSPRARAGLRSPRPTAKARLEVPEPKVRRAGRAIARLTRGMSYDQMIQATAWARKLLGVSRPVARKPVVVRLDRAELERLLLRAYTVRGEQGLMVETLVYTGARVAELVQLQVEDFSHEQQQVVIRRGKGGKDRVVPILPALADKLRVYLSASYRNTGPIFRSRQGGRRGDRAGYSTRRVQQLVRQLAAEAGITKRVYPHLMRHTVAQLLLEGGMPQDQVQRFLGHENISTTQIYAQSSTAMIKDSYRKALSDGQTAASRDPG